jgi:hypothetical protein
LHSKVDFRKRAPSHFSSGKVAMKYRGFYGKEKLKRWSPHGLKPVPPPHALGEPPACPTTLEL